MLSSVIQCDNNNSALLLQYLAVDDANYQSCQQRVGLGYMYAWNQHKHNYELSWSEAETTRCRRFALAEKSKRQKEPTAEWAHEPSGLRR